MSLLQALQARAEEFVALRRDLHRHPELGLKEFRTSDLIAARLAEWGYTVHRGIAGTGLVAQHVGVMSAVSVLAMWIAAGIAQRRRAALIRPWCPAKWATPNL